MVQDKLTAFFHQPFGSTGSATNSHSIHILEPVEVDFIGTFYLITVGVHTMTFLEEHLAVGTLASAHKEHEVVLGSKTGYIRHTIGHLSADGVKTLESGALYNMLLTILYDTMKLVETLSRLGIEIDIAREIQFLHILEFLNHDGLAGSLPHQSQHLCVSILAKDDYLRIRIAGILPLDTFLQLQHHRTGGVNDVYMVSLGQGISLRRLTMSTQQHLDMMQFLHILVVDSNQPGMMQPFHLHSVVYDVA